MTGLEALLADLGINVASNVVWSTIQDVLQDEPTRDELVDALNEEIPQLDIEGAEAVADHSIELLAEEGLLRVRDSTLYAEDRLLMSSNPGTEFSLSGSTTETSGTRIDVGEGAEIRGSGGAEIEQGVTDDDEDGDDGGDIVFRT